MTNTERKDALIVSLALEVADLRAKVASLEESDRRMREWLSDRKAEALAALKREREAPGAMEDEKPPVPCSHCGNLDAPHELSDGTHVCSGCLSAMAD